MFGSKRKTRRKTGRGHTKHYRAHKEIARAFVHARIRVHNTTYGYVINRVSIRNQKTCWGSCSELGNLNFNYAVLFLPRELADYVIIHELCHLEELNHSERFWKLVAQTVPEYRLRRRELRKIPTAVGKLAKVNPISTASNREFLRTVLE